MPRDSPVRPTSPNCSSRCHPMTSAGSCAGTPKRCSAPRDAVDLIVDLRYPEHAEAFRREVRAFLAEHPNAASDLAALSTRAVRDGADWVIDGQKTWTSLAADASWIFLLARTDPSARGHRGISFLLCPMDQPGIEVRPIEMLNHEHEFCEVYFTGARTAAANVVGEVGAGWNVAMTLLTHERGEE